MSMRMTILAAGAVLGLGVFSLHAEDGGEVEVRKIGLPIGFPEPTESDKKLLALGDAALLRAYDAMRKHDEKTAIDELNKAMAFRNQVIQSKMTSKELAGKGYYEAKQGTAVDKVDVEGGLERFLEIKKTGGQMAAADHDYELHKRKVIKDSEKEAKKLAEEQKELAEMLQQLAMTQPQAGGGKQNKNQPQNQPQQAQANGGGEQQQNQNQPQNPNGQQQANAQNPDGQQQENPQNPNGQPQANQQNPNGQPQANQQNPNGQPQANQQNPNGQPQANQQNPNGAQDPAGQAAQKQDEITGMLNQLATKLDQASRKPGDQQAKAAEAFRQAAESGQRTADNIRKGEMQAAAANGRNTEQRIREALAAAGMANTTSLETALENVEREIKRLQNEQQKVLDQAQRAGEGANGKEADERVRNERTKALAGQQAGLMGQIKELQNQVNALAQGTGTNDPTQRTPENAARQELQGASRAMQGKRAAQAATNAAVQLGQGDIQSASKSMAQVQEALNAARQKVADAGNALTGEDRTAAERTLRELKNLTSSLRRLEQTAQAAANGGEGAPNPDGKTAEGKGEHPRAGEGKDPAGKSGDPAKGEGKDPAAAKTGEGKTGEGKGEQDPKGSSEQAGREEQGKEGVSATWGQVLNRSAKDAQAEAMKMAGRLEKFTEKADAKAIENASKKETEFERDFTGSLKQVRALLAELEKAEVDLQSKVSKEQEKRAMKNIQKDNVPSEYRGAVAAYYEELSKEGGAPDAKEEPKK
ncbi:MAG: hypothetical protein KIS92_05615 [Planctomycetota bacterium]|nr:hypothetical protein [Planctomycetota bacterium]